MPSIRQVYRPQKALLVDEPPEGDAWIHELKLDGYRVGVVIANKRVRLLSRRGTEYTDEFPEIVAAARRLRVREAVIDGEVVVVLENGLTSFQALQNRAQGRGGLAFYAFDLLSLDGEDLARLPLVDRKRRLQDFLGRGQRGMIRYVSHVIGNGAAFFRKACELGAEGIVSKRADARYRFDARHADWQKTKCLKRQEFVVGGFTDPEGSRVGIGSLLIGFYDGKALKFAGKVGTGPGWTERFGRELRHKLDTIAQRESPFEPRPPGWLGRNAHWVKPRLVAEVEFTEWTVGGNVRHPSLQGFRTDKKPRDVLREVPVEVDTTGGPRDGERPRSRGAKHLELTQPDALVYPDLGVTKEELAQLYIDIHLWALPHVLARPLTLVRRRAPITRQDALRSQCMFLHHTKRDNAWVPEWMPRIDIREKRKLGNYLYVDSIESLLALIEGDIVEWHVWNASVRDVEHPDRVVFDLDPGDHVPWSTVVGAARRLRTMLEYRDLESWVKTTGGRGLHVVVPFRPEHEWDEVFTFARGLAESLAGDDPETYTVSFDKRKRVGKVLIDYKRNYRTSIAVAGFSPRAKPNGAMAVPVTWAELGRLGAADRFTVESIRRRLHATRTDPWRDYWTSRQRLDVGSHRRITARKRK